MTDFQNGGGRARTAFLLVTDIHRSTQLWERHRSEFKNALERHNNEVEMAVHDHGGEIMKNLGDGYIAIFTQAHDCLSCGVEVQKRVGAFEPMADGTRLKVRVVAHGGTLVPLAAGKGWFGQPLNRASRICQVCHPGQTLVSEVVKTFVGVPASPLKFVDLGQHRLRDLAEPERIYQVDHPEFEVHSFDPLPTLVGYRPNNLVIQPNAFIGRESELAELKSVIVGQGRRLVTITASGGYGKSRIAMQLCANLLDDYSNGVFAVMLSPVGDHSRVVSATADALGFQFYGGGDPQTQLLDYLREKEMLVLFDNFEHVLEASELLSAILAKAAGVSLVVTSREPLRIEGEKIYKLEPLAVGENDKGEYEGLSDAVALFFDRASLVDQRIAVTPESICVVQDICRQLGGAPLAIELAAAWADSFTLPELLSEVESQLELTARMKNIPARHRSIRASLDWSYNLLTDEQRAILRAVSCFRGGFFAEAGEAVAGIKGLRIKLAGLCDKSWLYTREVEGQTRFFIRDAAAREYASEILRESGDWEKFVFAHSTYYAGLIEREGPKLEGYGQLEAARSITVELENLFEALDTALNRNAEELILPFSEHLWGYGEMVSKWIQCLPWYERMLEAGDKLGSEGVRMKALLGIGNFSFRLGRYDDAIGRLDEARILAEKLCDGKFKANSLRGLGNVSFFQGRYSDAQKLLNESLEIFREIGYRRGIAACLNSLGNAANFHGRYTDAEKLFNESLEIFREIGDRQGIAMCIVNLGNAAYSQGRCAEAEKLFNESLEIYPEIGDRQGIAHCIVNLGNAAYSQGRYAKAEKLYGDSLEIRREIGDRSGIASCLLSLGNAASSQGRYAEADRLFAESLEMFREIGQRYGIASCLLSLGSAAKSQGRYADAEKLFNESLEILREIGHRGGIAAALSAMAQLRLTTGDLSTARSFLVEALGISKDNGNFESRAESLLIAGTLMEKLGHLEEGAILLAGFAHHIKNANFHPDSMNKKAMDEAWKSVEAKLTARGEAMTIQELIELAEESLKQKSAPLDNSTEQNNC